MILVYTASTLYSLLCTRWRLFYFRYTKCIILCKRRRAYNVCMRLRKMHMLMGDLEDVCFTSTCVIVRRHSASKVSYALELVHITLCMHVGVCI